MTDPGIDSKMGAQPLDLSLEDKLELYLATGEIPPIAEEDTEAALEFLMDDILTVHRIDLSKPIEPQISRFSETAKNEVRHAVTLADSLSQLLEADNHPEAICGDKAGTVAATATVEVGWDVLVTDSEPSDADLLLIEELEARD